MGMVMKDKFADTEALSRVDLAGKVIAVPHSMLALG
jgi:hypothetical protein